MFTSFPYLSRYIINGLVFGATPFKTEPLVMNLSESFWNFHISTNVCNCEFEPATYAHTKL